MNKQLCDRTFVRSCKPIDIQLFIYNQLYYPNDVFELDMWTFNISMDNSELGNMGRCYRDSIVSFVCNVRNSYDYRSVDIGCLATPP